MKKEDIIKNLSTYSPPEMVWERIESELSNPSEGLKPSEGLNLESNYSKTRLLWTIYLVAACVTALVVGSWWYFQNPVENITYSEEKINKSFVPTTSLEVEKQNAKIEAICAEKITVCEKPEFKSLKLELDELNTAHKQLKEVIGNYNPDPTLIAQLADIEIERSAVLKKLVEKI